MTVTNKRTQVHLLLAPVVTAAELHLTQLPTDVTQVEVELSPACTALNLAGERSGVGAVTVPLVRDAAGTWNSGTRYLLPAGSAPTRLSIRWVRNGEQAVYGYTYPQALTPGTPYRFEGAFVDDAPRNGGRCFGGRMECPHSTEFSFRQRRRIAQHHPTTARRRWTNRRRHVVDRLGRGACGTAMSSRSCRTSWVTKPTSC